MRFKRRKSSKWRASATWEVEVVGLRDTCRNNAAQDMRLSSPLTLFQGSPQLFKRILPNVQNECPKKCNIGTHTEASLIQHRICAYPPPHSVSGHSPPPSPRTNSRHHQKTVCQTHGDARSPMPHLPHPLPQNQTWQNNYKIHVGYFFKNH